MKAVLLLTLALVAATALPVDHLRFASRRRAGGTWASNKYTCPDSTSEAGNTAGHVWGKMPLGNPTNVKLDADYTFVSADSGQEKIGYDASTGLPLTGKMKDKGACDMCKVQPKEICSHDGNGFCGDIGNGYCCMKLDSSLSACKAKGVGRKYMPQLLEKIGSTPVDLKSAASYGTLLTWLESKGVKNSGAKGTASTAKCKISDLKPTQDEIFWDKTINKICYTWDASANSGAGALAMRGSNAVSGTPDTPPFVDKDCKIIDGHHRWSQAALCSMVTSCAAPTNNEIDVIKTDLSAVDVLKALIDFAKGSQGWSAASSQAKNAKLTNTDATVYYVSTGPADFLEVDSQFGRSSHQSVAQAAAAFVANRRAALAEIGVELKGGDEALEDLFMTYHAPRLWN